jgi:hypothetical protein
MVNGRWQNASVSYTFPLTICRFPFRASFLSGLIMPSGKKLGFAAFLFFLVKGLLWLMIPAAVYVWGC